MQIKDTPIQEIKIPNTDIYLAIKREDLIHDGISGNKYWKLYYNLKNYIKNLPPQPLIITFGGAFSNHIAATAFAAKENNIACLGIIRGEENAQNIHSNPTLHFAQQNGMQFRFVTREEYRNQEKIHLELQKEFPNALIIPEGGSNHLAVKGIAGMLNEQTKEFDYLCTAVGTGGTLAGLCEHAELHQKVLGFAVVNDPDLVERVENLTSKKNFEMISAHDGAYGKIIEDNVDFINHFLITYGIPLDPIYTGKMMRHLLQFIDKEYFPKGSRILAFHTGGLQGIAGANALLKKKNKTTIISNGQ